MGDAVKSFTSENATVVVGTVIDSEMTDELRVTVVVTGLGRVGASSGSVSGAQDRQAKTVKSDGTLNYNQLDRPTYQRNQSAPRRAVEVEDSKDIEYLDIPAFLRRQEDD